MNLYEEVRQGMLAKDPFNYGYDALEQVMTPNQLLIKLHDLQEDEKTLQLIFRVAQTQNVETVLRMLMR